MIYSFSGYCFYLSELCLYLSTAGTLIGLFCDTNEKLMLGVFALAGLVSMFFSRKENWVRFVPMVLILPAFLYAPSAGAVVIALPMAMLLGFHILRRSWNTGNAQVTDMMKVGFGLFFFVLLSAFVFSKYAIFEAKGIPLFITWMLLSVLTLRVMRNEEVGKTGPLFYVLNTGLVAVVGFVGFCISSPAFLGIVKSGLRILYDNVLGPVLMLLAYIAMAIPILLGWLLSKIKLKDPEPIESEMEMASVGEQLQELMEENGTEVSELSETLKTAGIVVGALVFLLICFLIFRSVVDYSSKKEKKTVGMMRERASAEAPAARRRRHSAGGAAEAVRVCYRKYLNICKNMMIPVDGSIASDEILLQSQRDTGPEDSAKLRRLWLPVRYGEGEASEETAREAKDALRRIKDHLKAQERSARSDRNSTRM